MTKYLIGVADDGGFEFAVGILTELFRRIRMIPVPVPTVFSDEDIKFSTFHVFQSTAHTSA